jgi:diguanylate cyclase (GGDEF)-like protein
VPAADTAIDALVARHADDHRGEKADVATFTTQWSTLRTVLVKAASARASAAPGALDELTSSYAPLTRYFDKLIERENADALADQHNASATMRATTWAIAIAIATTVLAAVGSAWVAIGRVRRALRPEEDQTEFADTMQLADGELEAHGLIKRHLERTVPRSSVTVLNRNNSADRLEAVTELAPDSCLARTLAHAEPRSCLAVRSGRPQRQGGRKSVLLGCTVCGECAGSSICTPLTVGGEVIGSVLLNAPQAPTGEQENRVRTSVSQAAPVLANLRNLAIAETRAATDALTGLPNKRAVGDTLKRMLAHASRALTPMAVVCMDLDHFKDINDKFGHPVGDQALADVGAALTAVLRDSDFAGRNGGEEFTVLLPDTDVEGAARTAEKIRAAIAEIRIAGGTTPLTASLGVAVYPVHATSAEQLERLADSALYVAKRAGRNRAEIARNESTDPQSAPTQTVASTAPARGLLP